MTLDPAAQAVKMHAINTGLQSVAINYIDPLKLASDVLLGEFAFNRIDEDGIVWVIQEIDGWWGPPEPTTPDYPRGNADGSYDVRGRWNAREITLRGTFLVPDASYVPLARQRLVDAANLVYTGTWMRVNESNYNKVAWVRLSGRPQIQTVNARGRTEFEISLRSSDPIKYSWSPTDTQDGFNSVGINCLNLTTGALGNAIVTNVGNTPVPVIISILGPASTNVYVQNVTTNQILFLNKNIPSESTLTIDTYDNSVDLDGVISGARSYVEPLVDWITLDPGENSIDFVDSSNFTSSGAQMTMYYRSGWIG